MIARYEIAAADFAAQRIKDQRSVLPLGAERFMLAASLCALL